MNGQICISKFDSLSVWLPWIRQTCGVKTWNDDSSAFYNDPINNPKIKKIYLQEIICNGICEMFLTNLPVISIVNFC
jgi:hypothetical protein